jgi:hypothetical protein
MFGHSEETYSRFMMDQHWHLFCWHCSGDLGAVPDEFPNIIKPRS